MPGWNVRGANEPLCSLVHVACGFLAVPAPAWSPLPYPVRFSAYPHQSIGMWDPSANCFFWCPPSVPTSCCLPSPALIASKHLQYIFPTVGIQIVHLILPKTIHLYVPRLSYSNGCISVLCRNNHLYLFMSLMYVFNQNVLGSQWPLVAALQGPNITGYQGRCNQMSLWLLGRCDRGRIDRSCVLRFVLNYRWIMTGDKNFKFGNSTFITLFLMWAFW